MAGELVPLVLIPRYTTVVGANTYTTIGMEVTDYSKALVNVWRSTMIGTSGTFGCQFEESTDQETWSVCSGGTGGDPSADTEAQYTPVLAKRWFRIKITTTGTNAGVTMWAIGFLELREA